MKNQVIIEKALSCGFVNKAKKYGILCHKTTNCLYDKQPFEVHLEMVYNIACEFSHLLKTGNMVKCCLAAAWTHDVINSCRQNYDAVKRECGREVAEITYALTKQKGKTRASMFNEVYYIELRDNPLAIYTKLCDRIANVTYAKATSNKAKFDRLKKENTAFYLAMTANETHIIYNEMWQRLHDLFEN